MCGDLQSFLEKSFLYNTKVSRVTGMVAVDLDAIQETHGTLVCHTMLSGRISNKTLFFIIIIVFNI